MDSRYCRNTRTVIATMRQLSTLILLIVGHFAFGQSKNCNCPKNDLTAAGKADRIFTFSNDLPKYSPTQIKTVINEYKKLTKQSGGDSTLLIAHRLFWAYVSGSKEA